MDDREIARLQGLQDGVISRRQVLGAGGTDNEIERLVRRRQWARIQAGVYADHTGRLTWGQRAWGAVLATWPAALDGKAALRAHGMRTDRTGDTDPIAVVIEHRRHVDRHVGVSVRRSTTFDSDVQVNLSPPRVRLEIAVLRVAAGYDRDDEAVATLADACQSGRTTAARLLFALRGIGRIRHRRLLEAILDDVARGAYSALERRYLVRVERAHGLPAGSRQRRVRVGTRIYLRDVEYVGLSTLVELDGRLGHDAARDRWADLDRDLTGARVGDLTLRVGWRQVLQPHRLAALVGGVLVARGWGGRVRPCGPSCPIAEAGGFPAPDAGDPPARASA